VKLANLSGKRFNRLVVVNRAKDRIEPSGRKRVMWLCLCDCGNYIITAGDSLRAGTTQSCGCLCNELSAKRREADLSGMTFGYWKIEDEAFRDKNGIHWNAICICGNKGTPTSNNLLQGNSQSCGCYNKALVSELKRKDITNQRFGIVTALECVGKNNYNNYLWKCLCDCGTEFIVPTSRLLIGDVQSCGCVHSKGEQYISKYLSEKGIMFKHNFYFSDLKLNGYLFFDYKIEDKNGNIYLIEYQGIQHYKEFPNGFGDQQRLITDKMKKEYCAKNNITLFEIRYDENIEDKMNEIVMQVNPVLSE
jgi:hypothetical protein